MDEQPAGKAIKVGVKEGAGAPPGYKWNVDLLSQVHGEAMSFLTPDQYGHLAEQVRELARGDEPTKCQTVDVRPIEDYFEIRDKGGLLKKINARIFFCVCHSTRTIAVVGAINKKNDGPTPDHVKILMRYRTRRYLEEHGKC
jgi:hypothetical protein